MRTGPAEAATSARALTLTHPQGGWIMAQRKAITFRSLYTAYLKGLKAMGCTFCPTCYAYLMPDHACVTAAAVELQKAA